MQVKNLFAAQFAKSAQASNKSQFEVRFNAVQRGLLNQMNEKIAKAEDDGTQKEIAELQKKRDKLFDKADTLRNLQSDIKTNALRFLDIRDMATSAVSAADADEDSSLSEDEVTALNAVIAELKTEVSKLKFSHNYTEFTDGNLANRMRQTMAELDELTAVTGTIDASGSGSPSNDNRAILDKLTSIASQSNTYADSSTVLVGSLNTLITSATKTAYSFEADLADLTLVRINEKEEEVANIQTQYGNLIRSISLAFEVQSGLGDALAASLNYQPDKGSILNIFT